MHPSTRRHVMLTIALGLLVLLLKLLTHKPLGVSLGLAFDVVIGIVIVIAARSAKKHNKQPWQIGALLGMVYSAFSNISVFLIRRTQASVTRSLSHQHLPSRIIAQTSHLLNSASLHVALYISSLISGIVIGLILGTISGIFVQSDAPHTV